MHLQIKDIYNQKYIQCHQERQAMFKGNLAKIKKLQFDHMADFILLNLV